MSKTFSITTLGCKLNQYDSSLIAAQLAEMGLEQAPPGEMADLVIVNTCTVTDRSDKKCRNLIRQGARRSKAGRVIVTGCLADAGRDELLAMPEVMAVFGNEEKGSLAGAALSLGREQSGIRVIPQKPLSTTPLPFRHTRGFLKIQDGCDNSCSYCIIPSVRGRARSRPSDEIIEHARALIESGCPELVLTGITIGNYDREGITLAGLVRRIIALEGNFRVRITSIEPHHVTDAMLDLFSDEKVCDHLHLPIQSGSDRILRLMNRPYSLSDYERIIERIHGRYPDLAIGTDLIIGFPGETETDFMESLNAVKRSGYSYVHQFTYSPRAGTPASAMRQQAGHEELHERARRLRETAAETGLAYRRRFEGRTLSCVIEKNRKRPGHTAVSGNYLKLSLGENAMANPRTGAISPVTMTKAGFPLSEGVPA